MKTTTIHAGKDESEEMKLVYELINAKNAAEALADSEDGGTCNFDCCVLYFKPGTRESSMLRWGECAGLFGANVRTWFGRKCLFLNVGTGQGNRNTRMEEAACDILKSAGYDARMYYQMD